MPAVAPVSSRRTQKRHSLTTAGMPLMSSVYSPASWLSVHKFACVVCASAFNLHPVTSLIAATAAPCLPLLPPVPQVSQFSAYLASAGLLKGGSIDFTACELDPVASAVTPTRHSHPLASTYHKHLHTYHLWFLLLTCTLWLLLFPAIPASHPTGFPVLRLPGLLCWPSEGWQHRFHCWLCG